MRLRSVEGAKEYLSNSSIVYNLKTIKKVINLNSTNILVIGVGRSDFIFNYMEFDKRKMFFGVEKYESALVRTIKENENDSQKNVAFLNIDAIYLKNYFPQNSIDKIYINFPDPWPKEKHKKRRLISKKFIDLYKFILKEKGEIVLKTDQYFLYKEFLQNAKDDHDLKILKKSKNIYRISSRRFSKLDEAISIKTKYEKKFIKDSKINFLRVMLNK